MTAHIKSFRPHSKAGKTTTFTVCPPRTEALCLMHLIQQGSETEESIRELIGVGPRTKRFLERDGDRRSLGYRLAVLREFNYLARERQKGRVRALARYYANKAPAETSMDVRVRASGQLLAEMGKNGQRIVRKNVKSQSTISKLSDLGITKDQSSACQQLAGIELQEKPKRTLAAKRDGFPRLLRCLLS
jgi:hypothetical protein